MKEVGARDRLVMAGLVVLGLLTVIAGVLSGRSTINYVLARDAREAALAWAEQINKNLAGVGSHAPQLLDRKLDVLNADRFADQIAKPADLPASLTARGEFNLAEELGRRTTGWLLNRVSEQEAKFVSELDGFAVLGADRGPLAVGGNLDQSALEAMLAQGDVKAAVARAASEDAVVTAVLPGDKEHRLALVPAMHDGKLARIYAFAVDQSAAASLTNTRSPW